MLQKDDVFVKECRRLSVLRQALREQGIDVAKVAANRELILSFLESRAAVSNWAELLEEVG